MAPILGPDGQALAAHGWHDTESIAVSDGILYVGIEGVNQIVQFDFAKDGLLARGHPIAVPPGIRTLPKNRGLEALEYVPQNQPMGGTLIAISERGLDKVGNIRAFLIGGLAPGTFAIKRKDQFDVTDAALLPSGDLLILERSLSWPEGLLVQIRRIPLKDVKPDAVVDGPVLFEADLSCEIDNMEGLAVHQTADSEIVLTLVSDDNFSPLQRTELLQFTVVPEWNSVSASSTLLRSGLLTRAGVSRAPGAFATASGSTPTLAHHAASRMLSGGQQKGRPKPPESKEGLGAADRRPTITRHAACQLKRHGALTKSPPSQTTRALSCASRSAERSWTADFVF